MATKGPTQKGYIPNHDVWWAGSYYANSSQLSVSCLARLAVTFTTEHFTPLTTRSSFKLKLQNCKRKTLTSLFWSIKYDTNDPIHKACRWLSSLRYRKSRWKTNVPVAHWYRLQQAVWTKTRDSLRIVQRMENSLVTIFWTLAFWHGFRKKKSYLAHGRLGYLILPSHTAPVSPQICQQSTDK